MKTSWPTVTVFVAALLPLAAAPGCAAESASGTKATPHTHADERAKNWPQFRGPTGDGMAPPSARPPVDIDPKTDVLWKSPVPASGHSSPIVWGRRVFLTGEGMRILAFDRLTGKLLWNTQLQVDPAPPADDEEEPFDPGEYGAASPTACTDGHRVYAFFGSGVIGCVDLDGRQIWSERLVDRPNNSFGLAASPILHNNVLIQQVDLEPDEESDELEHRSFIVGLESKDGKELWRTQRPVYSSWTTPLLVREGPHRSVVTCAPPWVIAYDPADGRERWRVGGLRNNVAGSPVATDGLVFAVDDPAGSVLAIRLGGAGDVTKSRVAWTFDEDLPDVASPVCDGERYFHLGERGVLKCLDAHKGTPLWDKEFPGMFYASPVLADGKLFLIDTDGVLRILSPMTAELLGQADLGEEVNASPAFVGASIYIRGTKHLFCLAETDEPPS